MKNKKDVTKLPDGKIETHPGDTKVLLLLAFIALVSVVAVYWNHFDNSFHFDDNHTIESNVYIRDLKSNYKKYFTDATTITPLPANQSYRPVITLSYGIDYWISNRLGRSIGNELEALEKAKKVNTPEYKELAEKAAESRYIIRKGDNPKPFIFHCSNFLWYLVQCLLMYFFIVCIFNITAPHRYNRFFALFATTFYMLHTANAETINYICARTDSYSTMLLMLGLVMYQYWQPARQFFLYLIPVFIGILAKPSAVMFGPLLIVYIYLVEQQLSLTDIFKGKTWEKLLKKQVIVTMAMGMLAAIIGYYIVDKKTPETFIASQGSTHDYIITQAYVWLLYFITFFMPTHLSADTDLLVFSSMADWRFLVGFLFVVALFVSATLLTKKKENRPIAFGLFWFILALLPSSSFKALSEAMNDHRIFFPFIGLIISSVWGLVLLYRKYEKSFIQSGLLKTLGITACLAVLGGHAYGTVQRNKVWHDEESLWFDVTVKSPKNGRGLMNYGLSQYRKSFVNLGKNDIEGATKLVKRAISYYEKGLEYLPRYSYLFVNLAIAYDQLGMLEGNPQKYNEKVEDLFIKGRNNAMGYYGGFSYYGGWLWKHGRKQEAIDNAVFALKYGPDYEQLYTDLMSYYLQMEQWDNLKATAELMLKRFPGNQWGAYYLSLSQTRRGKLQELQEITKANPTPQNYLALSLEYFYHNQFTDCINACYEALKVDPQFSPAYNNICSAYNMLGEYDKAIEACNKALKIDPTYQLAKNNLKGAIDGKKADQDLKSNPTPEKYINAGLVLHKRREYDKAIKYYEKAIQLKPDYALAYSNICSAYNDLGQFSKGIPYGEKAVALDPTNQRYKNNLKISQTGKP